MNKHNQNQYNQLSKEFSERDYSGSRYLIYREVPKILTKLALKTSLILDIGCGAGRSTRFLKEQGYNPLGIDINYNLLKLAKDKDKEGTYIFVKDEWPFRDNLFDVAYCQLVLLELPSKAEIFSLFLSVKRILSDNGALIIVTATPESSSPGEWLSISTNFKENALFPKSGDKVRKLLLPENILLTDHHWEESDIAEIGNSAGLKLTKSVRFMARSTDPYIWKDEITTPPYMAYILNKI